MAQVISNYRQIQRLPGYFDRFRTYDVRDYGAVGSGLVDDAAGIQAAINAAVSVGGGVVYLPSGTYAIGSDIILDSRVALIGQPEQTFIQPFTANINPLISCTGTNEAIKRDVFVQNITFRNSDPTRRNAAGTVFLSHVDNVFVSNVKRFGTSLDSGQSVVSIRRARNFYLENIQSINTFLDSDTLTFSGTWVNTDNAALVIGNVSVQHICSGSQTPAQVASAVAALASASTHPNFTQYTYTAVGNVINVSAVVPGTPINISQSVGSGQGNVTGTQNFQACIYALQVWDGCIQRVHSQWVAEIIDLSGCYNVHIDNVTGSDCNQEGIDFGSCSDMIVNNVSVDRARRVLQVKTELTGSTRPDYVDPAGSNRNVFSNIRGTYTQSGVRNTANTTGPVHTLNNNKFSNIDLRSVGVASESGFVISRNTDGSPNENCILDNFRIIEENGVGIFLSQAVQNFSISNGLIQSKGRAINHDYPSTIAMGSRGVVSNISMVITDTATLYAMWFGPRRGLVIRDVDVTGAGLYLLDQLDLTVDNLSIAETSQRAIYIQWRGQNTTNWPVPDNRVNAVFRDVRLKNTNKVSQTIGFSLTQDNNVSEVKGVTIENLSITDTQVTKTSRGLLFSGNFTDYSLLNSFVPETTSPIALADPRAAFITGATAINRGNRGWMLSENAGQVSIANTASSTDIVTSINGIAADDVTLTPINATAAAMQYWITYVNQTTVRVNLVTPPGSGNTATWAWVAERKN